MVSPPFLRLGARQPGATLERRMPRERPPTQSVHTAIMGSKGVIITIARRLITIAIAVLKTGEVWHLEVDQ